MVKRQIVKNDDLTILETIARFCEEEQPRTGQNIFSLDQIIKRFIAMTDKSERTIFRIKTTKT